MPAPHVLIIVENLPVPFDRRVWNEARALRRAGYDVSIICPTGKDAKSHFEVLDDIEIHRHELPLEASGALAYLAEYSAALYWEFRLARRINRKKRIDAIHACNPPDLIFLVGLFFKLFGRTKFVFDHHDVNPELFEAKFGRRGVFYWLVRLFERLTFMSADMSIATNESYRDIAIKRGRMKPNRVFIVRSGPDLARMRIVAPNPKWRNGRAFLVAYVGVMGQQEGIPYLFKAVEQIVRGAGRKDIQFCLVGSGPEFATLQKLAQEMGIGDYVTMTGRAPDADLVEILNTADVCVNPDAVNPMNDLSTMNKIMEYMAVGKPIVQFELREGRFTAQEASLYAKPNDPIDFAAKILELLADPERRRKMGAFGMERVESKLAWKHEEPKLLAAYASLGLGHGR